MQKYFTYNIILALAILGITFASFKSVGQPLNKITFLKGGNVQFICNSLEKYKDGIDLNGYTKLRFRFNDITSSGWKLSLKTSDNLLKSDGEYADIQINDTLSMQITSFSSTDDTIASHLLTPFYPSTGELIIAQGSGGDTNVTDIVTVEIELSYNLSPMLNKSSGFYYVDLEFNLSAK